MLSPDIVTPRTTPSHSSRAPVAILQIFQRPYSNCKPQHGLEVEKTTAIAAFCQTARGVFPKYVFAEAYGCWWLWRKVGSGFGSAGIHGSQERQSQCRDREVQQHSQPRGHICRLSSITAPKTDKEVKQVWKTPLWKNKHPTSSFNDVLTNCLGRLEYSSSLVF